jgi:hypothetical protein
MNFTFIQGIYEADAGYFENRQLRVAYLTHVPEAQK